MSISANAVRFDETMLWVDLSDGRVIGAPLTWFPKLARAGAAERASVEISRRGLHWDALDEDLSIAGLLAGAEELAAAA